MFLDASIANGVAPASLDFTPTGLGTDFTTLSPVLGQVFYIGDGVTSGNVFQEFTAPAGATRLALGIPDGFGFDGPPGAYDDNDGAYIVRVAVNEIPTVPSGGTTLAMLVMSLVGLSTLRRRFVEKGA